jgi:carboxymethylenebutenolidase
METSFPAPAGPLPAYQVRPTGDGPWPGVVIVHDAMGMTADAKRITKRFAESGYLAITPALYHRGNRLLCVVRTLQAFRNGQGTAVDDLIAARDHLAADPQCTGKIGIIGFCMGGGFCLVLGPSGAFDASAPNYGEWPKDTSKIVNSCPTVASYGAKDRMLKGAAAKLEDILTAGGVVHDVKEYPEVGHSFMNQFPTPGPLKVIERVAGLAYSEPEAEDAWQRILTFFAEHLK